MLSKSTFCSFFLVAKKARIKLVNSIFWENWEINNSPYKILVAFLMRFQMLSIFQKESTLSKSYRAALYSTWRKYFSDSPGKFHSLFRSQFSNDSRAIKTKSGLPINS